MSSITVILAGVVKLFTALAGFFARRAAMSDGATAQRDHDMRVENERIAKAGAAADAVRSGGGVPIEIDANNRDNR